MNLQHMRLYSSMFSNGSTSILCLKLGPDPTNKACKIGEDQIQIPTKKGFHSKMKHKASTETAMLVK